ncbi:TolC family protein [Colwellia sp. M166]|uniref:TolC family protein n=1 Tax=Colwellia sp. M166 TaxID=2583805 RepID=UPI00211EB6BA|nr:TolC family protein [Colwellia sp. M166]UUO24349.1 TolC family protein [Colwellia sp. M166]|tara:strand:- start:39242 stop:40696 length:1455 start_codon:yes stop_codon:yes gene_type:complete
MLKNNHYNQVFINVGLGVLMMTSLTALAEQSVQSGEILTFKQAIKVAQQHDPWLKGNRHQQQAIESASISANTLPDPKISVGMGSLPTDSFDLNQEGMTQLKIGVSQMIPRGDTLKFKSQQLQLESEMYPYQRLDRAAKVAVTVGGLWLDAYRVQQSVVLIEKNRSLFEQLADVAEASYSSTLGKTRQQDIVRAQLELTRLEERLDKLAQQKNKYDGMLLQWLTRFASANHTVDDAALYSDLSWHDIALSQQLPSIDLLNSNLVYAENWLKPQDLVPFFYPHPAVIAVDKKVNATKTGIKLAKQKYKPEWGVNASYGYRADDPMGQNRADLFSVGVTFDLPIFTENRQDQDVRSAVSKTEAIKTEKLLLLRQLLGAYSSAKGRLLRVKERQNLYNTKLLPQIHDQAEASLTAYTNDDGDFAEVVRARIAVLNAEIDDLTLNVEEQKIHLELNYLFIGGIKTAMTENNLNVTNSSQYAAMSGERE